MSDTTYQLIMAAARIVGVALGVAVFFGVQKLRARS